VREDGRDARGGNGNGGQHGAHRTGGEDGANAGGWYRKGGASAHGVRDVDRQVGRQVQRCLLGVLLVVPDGDGHNGIAGLLLLLRGHVGENGGRQRRHVLVGLVPKITFPENAVGAELVFRQVGARGCGVVALITMKSHAFVFIPNMLS